MNIAKFRGTDKMNAVQKVSCPRDKWHAVFLPRYLEPEAND